MLPCTLAQTQTRIQYLNDGGNTTFDDLNFQKGCSGIFCSPYTVVQKLKPICLEVRFKDLILRT